MDNSREKEIRQQIDAYVKGQLGEIEIEELWNEFARNPELLEILEIEVNVKELIEQNANNSNEHTKINKLPSWTWHALAAAAILMVALVQLFQVDTPTELNQFVVNQINPAEIETSDGVRAKEMQISPADSLLNLGFEAAISGNESRALELYEEVISRYSEEPYGSKAHLNKGILLYNEGDYEAAMISFREALNRSVDSRMITEKAYWYLGNALINTNELQAAQDAIFQAYQLDGMFRRPAFKLLKKLSDDLGETDYEEFKTPELE